MTGGQPAGQPAAPAEQPAEADPQGAGGIESLLSSLSFAQLPNVKATVSASKLKTESQQSNTQDEDGFEDQIFIQDDTNSNNGINEAVIIDPIASSRSLA